jgi:hypothetical protein
MKITIKRESDCIRITAPDYPAVVLFDEQKTFVVDQFAEDCHAEILGRPRRDLMADLLRVISPEEARMIAAARNPDIAP